MADPTPETVPTVGSVTVRYWASARAAAGVESDVLPAREGTTLADVLAAARSLHVDRPRRPTWWPSAPCWSATGRWVCRSRDRRAASRRHCRAAPHPSPEAEGCPRTESFTAGMWFRLIYKGNM